MRQLSRSLGRVVPGLALLVALAVIARVVGDAVPALSPLIVAIAIGVVIANSVGLPEVAAPGANRHKLLLETAIVLLGAQLTLDAIVEAGGTVVVLATLVVLFGVLYLELLARFVFGIDGGARAVLAAGASVCGVSAVLAVSGTVDVKESAVTYAVATILLFDAVTLVVFPAVEPLLDLTGQQFGIWAGLSLFSTGPTAAVGFAVSETAGRWATLTKLVRNCFIGVLAIGYALRNATADADSVSPTEVWTRFPKFLIGFLVVLVVANLGVLSQGALSSIERTTDWLFIIAFVGLGFDIEFHRLRAAGLRPVALVLVHLTTVSVLTYTAVTLLF
jgi:uncharacterized integral membrane protein (TIGR00698 family)